VSPQISDRVGESAYAKAKAQGRTVSQIARQALEEYING
jgi:hypothetical protein